MFHSNLLLSSFTPLDLFRAGEQGVWYDPSDFSTMFQDSAGTTPVTAVEQPVGKILDKSGRGNHATQSTSASRPVLSARVNLLTYSEQFDNAAWTKGALNTTGSPAWVNAAVAPDGSSNAEKLIGTASTIEHAVSVPMDLSGRTVVLSCAMKGGEYNYGVLRGRNAASYANAIFNLSNGTVHSAGVSATITSLGNGWYRCTATFTPNSTCSWVIGVSSDGASNISSTDGTSGIYIWGADLRLTNDGTGLPAYQRIAAATAYDTTGFPYYLKFDGTDDFLVTSSINPGSVDKAQMFAGVRKLADATGTIAEMSANPAVIAGTCGLTAAPGNGAAYGIRNAGSSFVTFNSPASYAAPITNILRGECDISGDSTKLAINGGTPTSSASDLGTGNFLSNVMYIGRRGGTTIPFNGLLYCLIFRFSASNMSSKDITNTETWVNRRTGAY